MKEKTMTKQTCDKEIGKPGSWHRCNRPAIGGSPILIRGTLSQLYYCAQHHPEAVAARKFAKLVRR